jgi:hypothetical protein
MNTLEDRIRAAVVQTAEEIAPGSIRPLSLPDQVPSGRRTRAGRAAKAGRGSARWPRVLIPIGPRGRMPPGQEPVRTCSGRAPAAAR